MTMVASEAVWCKEMKKMNDWYDDDDDERQIMVEETKETWVKMLNSKTRLNIEFTKINKGKSRTFVDGEKRGSCT